MPGHAWRNRVARLDRLPVADHADLVVDVVRHRHRAPQRDLLLREAADDRILQVPVRVVDLRHHGARQLHAPARKLRPQPAAIERARRERPLEAEDVELAVGEREPPALVLLDDADLDAADPRHRLALHLRDQRPVLGVVGREVPGEAAVLGVRGERDLRRAHPALEAIRPGTHRVGLDPAAGLGVGGDDLARHRGGRGVREHVREVRVGADKAQAQGVAIDRLDAGYRAVVVEAARPPRGVGERVEADELAGDEKRPRRAQCRIGKALERVGVVGGRELAPRAAKRRVRRRSGRPGATGSSTSCRRPRLPAAPRPPAARSAPGARGSRRCTASRRSPGRA